ncbi:hypothetical protein V5799_026920 [Amblyomma americanum]|uniref:Uncharacterized protein n=1 Tax=Amblyomma americanum TaxID=6943 RepID=A0AAQ4DH77_AMBAM
MLFVLPSSMLTKETTAVVNILRPGKELGVHRCTRKKSCNDLLKITIAQEAPPTRARKGILRFTATRNSERCR